MRTDRERYYERGRNSLLSAKPHKVFLDGCHAGLAAGGHCRAAGFLGFGAFEMLPNPGNRFIPHIRFDVCTGQPKARADRGVGILGIDRMNEAVGCNRPFKTVEIGDLTGRVRAIESRVGKQPPRFLWKMRVQCGREHGLPSRTASRTMIAMIFRLLNKRFIHR